MPTYKICWYCSFMMISPPLTRKMKCFLCRRGNILAAVASMLSEATVNRNYTVFFAMMPPWHLDVKAHVQADINSQRANKLKTASLKRFRTSAVIFGRGSLLLCCSETPMCSRRWTSTTLQPHKNILQIAMRQKTYPCKWLTLLLTKTSSGFL